MRATPYEDVSNLEIMSKQFINDLKQILKQNRSLSKTDIVLDEPVTEIMIEIRSLTISERLEIYKKQRINEQSTWYMSKAIYNRKRANFLFWVSILVHLIAIVMLLFEINTPSLNFPIGVVAVAASSILTWLQARKHNELNSSYALAAHEITLIKGEALSIKSNEDLSEFVINSENAFSREHTQWTARKLED